jgi:hypothetical protein
MGFWRSIYYLAGWDYPSDIQIYEQRCKKYLLTEEIKDRGDSIQAILKTGQIINYKQSRYKKFYHL